MEEQEPIVSLKEVTVAYGEMTVLDRVDLKIIPGSFAALLGPNGSGKTTLLKAILGLVRPVSGEVRVFGKAPWELGSDRKRLGYVPQIASVDNNFPIKIQTLVLMGRYSRIGLFRYPSKSDKDKAAEAMERVGIGNLADRPLARLSGGQRQRAFLARALVNDPELLLLDEPTTGVDAATTESFFELLHRLQKDGVTIMLVSHDVGVVASRVDRIVCVSKKLVAHGRPEEVLGSKELTRMYGCEAVFFHHGDTPHIVVDKMDCCG